MADQPSTRPAGLRRALGGLFGLAIAVGATVGGGILGTPGDVAAALPDTRLYLLVWVLGAGFTLLGANIYSELGAMLPSSGGFYVSARRAFGDRIGFFVGYADWVNWCLGPPALLLLAGDYLGGLFPVLHGHAMPTALALLLGLAALQWLGVRSGGRTQEITSLLKTLALLGLVVAAFALPHQPPAHAAPVPFAGGTSLLLAFGIAMQGVIFTYDSYYTAIYCGGEIQDPGRVIPRTMFQGVGLIIAIYLLLNVAYLAVLPVGAMAHDSFVGATMAHALFGSAGDTIIRVIMVVSILGTVNAEIMAAPRILAAMSGDGLFPRFAARINSGGTPALAMLAGLLVIATLMQLGSFQAVVAVDTILVVMLYLISFAALFALRRKEPETPRPFRAWGYPWLPGLALLVALALLVGMVMADRVSAMIVAALLLLSWPASAAVRRMISRPA